MCRTDFDGWFISDKQEYGLNITYTVSTLAGDKEMNGRGGVR